MAAARKETEQETRSKDFSFYTSETKQKIRDRVRSLLGSSAANKKVLTLGGLYAKDAKMFQAQNAVVFSVERDRGIFERQKKEVANYPIVPVLGTVENFVKNPLAASLEFDLVYLDYLGPYTLSKEETLKSVLAGNTLKKGGHLCLTLELARDDAKNIKGSVLESVTCGGNVEEYFADRQGCIEQAALDLAQKCSRKVKIVACESYRNQSKKTGKNSPQMLFLALKAL